MADFERAFELTLLAEGGYKLTNSPGDKGGQTYAGISRRANPGWPGWAYVDRSETPPSVLVRGQYENQYWDPLRLSEVRDQRTAEVIYDCAVNSGTKIAAKLAQLALGETPDGVVGAKTLGAINGSSDPSLFLARYAIARIARYRDICQRDQSQRKWLVGWLNRALAGAA